MPETMPETMPDTIVVLGVSIILISLVIAANWLAGGWKPAQIENADAAIARLKLDYPDFEATEAIVSADGSAALLAGATTQGVGLIKAMGDTLVTRVIGSGELKTVTLDTDAASPRLLIDLTDFSLKHAELSGPDGAALRQWHDRLTAVRQQGAAS